MSCLCFHPQALPADTGPQHSARRPLTASRVGRPPHSACSDTFRPRPDCRQGQGLDLLRGPHSPLCRRHEAELSSTCSIGVKNMWSFTSTYIQGVVLKHCNFSYTSSPCQPTAPHPLPQSTREPWERISIGQIAPERRCEDGCLTGCYADHHPVDREVVTCETSVNFCHHSGFRR